MNELRIEAAMSREQGNIAPLAEHLLAEAIAFFKDPRNEREYQEWKKAREAQKGA